ISGIRPYARLARVAGDCHPSRSACRLEHSCKAASRTDHADLAVNRYGHPLLRAITAKRGSSRAASQRWPTLRKVMRRSGTASPRWNPRAVGIDPQGRPERIDAAVGSDGVAFCRCRRPDLFCMVGVAREVAAFTGQALRPPEVALKERGTAASKL